MVYKRRLRKYQTGDMYGTYGSPLNASPYQSPINLNTLSAPSSINTSALMKQMPQANIQGVDPMRGIDLSTNIGGGSGYGGGVKGIMGSGAGAFGGQGAAVGAIADAAGSIISADQQKGAASKAVEGAAKAVPLWGGLFNLTRSLTGKVAGDRTNTARSVVANMLSPSSGLTHNLDRKKNALVTTFNPILGGVMQAKEARKEEERRKLREYYDPEEQERSRGILADYNTSGTVYAKYGLKFPAGGKLPYPTDGSEVEQLSSNSAVYRGDTHANGGIKLDIDQDQQPDIEVENNEVIKDNMVLSNRLSPSRHAKKFARTMGVVPKKRETYAKMAERIGKKKGQFEEGAESLSEAQRNTSQLMAERMDNAIDMLFMDQQQKKHTSDMKKMRYGGKYKSLTKMCALGGKFPGGGLYGPPDPPLNKSVGVLAPATPAEFNYLTPTTGGAVRRNQMAAQHIQNTARQSARGPYLTDEDYNRFQTITGGKLHTPGAYRSANVHYLPGNYQQQADSTVNASRIFSRLEPQAGFTDAMNYVKGQNASQLASLAGGLAYGGYTDDGDDGVYAKGGPIKKRRRVNIGRRRFKAKYPGFPKTLDNPSGYDIYSTPSRQALWNNNAPKVLMYTGKGYKDWSGDVFDNTPSPITVYAKPQKDLSKYAGRKPYAGGGYLPQYPEGDMFPYNIGGGKSNKRRLSPIADYWVNNPLEVGTATRTRYTPKVGDIPTPRYKEPLTMPEMRNFNVGDYKGDIAAGLGTIANQALIGSLETNFTPETVEGPTSAYTDRTGYLTNIGNQQFRTASRGIAGSSAQDNAALKANLYAKTLDNLSQNLDRETLRRDELTNRFLERKDRTNLINTGIRNQAKQLSMENRNQKKALTQANIDNLVRSFIGNEAMRDTKTTEFARNALIAAMSDDRGVSERYLKNLSPKIRRQLGYQEEGGTFKKGGIYIKPANRGKFTAFAKSKGMSVQGAARHVLANKGKYSSTIVKRANFARNAAKWKHEFGGTFDMSTPTLPEYKKGGIYIKPKNRGKFNALKKRTGKTTAQLRHSKNPLTRKRAVFAANAKKWKH